MERREAVKYISVLLGGAVVGGTGFLTGCKSETGKSVAWGASDIAYLDEIAETILPQTTTPGAKAAKVGDFMKIMVNDCYEESDQKTFREGMAKLNEESVKKYDMEFVKIKPEQRKDLLIAIDKEAKDYQAKVVKPFNDEENKKAKEDPAYTKKHKSPHYFTMMKQLTLLGYFTSEVGAKEALGYVSVPGRYEGCINYEKGKRWA